MWLNDYMLIDCGKIKSRTKLNKFKNEQLFITTFMRLFNEALNRYKITGLPDTCNERVILESLILYGCVTFFNYEGNVLSLPSAPSGRGWNVYGDPLSAWVYSRNGLFNKEIDLFVKGGDNSALIKRGMSGQISGNPVGCMVWESQNRYPFLNTIIFYAEAITDTLRTIDVNRLWLKHPFIPVCEESLIPTVKKLFNDYNNNQDFLPVSTGILDVDKFDLKNLDVSPDAIKSAIELCEWYESKFREQCGVKANSQVDKKGENLTSTEINVNEEYTDGKDNSIIEYINTQLDFVNEMLGTSMKCISTEPVKDDKESEDDNNDGDNNKNI